jgi:hypothetical protein
LSLEIKNIWKLNNLYVYSSVISAGGMVTEDFLKHLEKIGLTKKNLKNGAESKTITNVSSSRQIPRKRPFILGHRMKFFLLTEPNTTDILG